MTQEEKAKAYDEAKLRMSAAYNSNRCTIGFMNEIFPELKESEDERIRKELLEHCKNQAKPYIQTGNKCPQIQSWIAWLEKQGEQKPADKVEPKFHEGEWLCENETNNYARFIQILEIVNVQGKDRYRISRDIHKDEDVVEFGFVEKYYHKFDIQDAKDGDVLIDKSGNRECPFIFKETKQSDIKTDMLNPLTVLGYCGIGGAGFTKGSGWGDTANCIYYPATKEQRDTLMKAMHEAGYEWDAEKKELKKIEQKPVVSLDENGEPILTPFEAELFSMMSDAWQNYSLGEEVNIAKIVKEHSEELLERANEQKPTDKVEPKFKVGDYIERKDGLGCHAKIIFVGGNVYGCEKLIHSEDESPFFEFMFKNQDEFQISSDFKQKPADADLKDIVDKEANAIWKEINTGGSHSIIDSFNQFYRICMQVAETVVNYQKPAEWIQELESKLSNATPEQLAEWKEKYFKVEPAWSEEDERTYKSIIYSFAHNYPLTIQQQEFIKSLRHQNTWKPSDEQIATFWDAICNLNHDSYKWIDDLKSLFQDLKKLRKE